jgi:hypothetical protein
VARNQRPGPRRQLTRPFGSQDAQGEMVVHTLQAIFDRNSCHVPSLFSRRLPANGGLWDFRSRHGAEAAMTS